MQIPADTTQVFNCGKTGAAFNSFLNMKINHKRDRPTLETNKHDLVFDKLQNQIKNTQKTALWKLSGRKVFCNFQQSIILQPQVYGWNLSHSRSSQISFVLLQRDFLNVFFFMENRINHIWNTVKCIIENKEASGYYTTIGSIAF